MLLFSNLFKSLGFTQQLPSSQPVVHLYQVAWREQRESVAEAVISDPSPWIDFFEVRSVFKH